MHQIKDIMRDVITYGEWRTTRTGRVKSIWNSGASWNLSNGFPATTAKTLAWKSVVGELLWFLSGSDTLKDLRRFTFGEDCPSDKWTIWTDDAKRWNESFGVDGIQVNTDYVGSLYPTQWRHFGISYWDIAGVDQIANLVEGLKNNPFERNHIVMAWNPLDIANNDMALKPCHLGFQCYVTSDGFLNLKWWQRSVDCFLGLGFNVASYALLTHMLCEWTGLKPGKLSCDLGDVHIYENHMTQAEQYIYSDCHQLPELVLPEKAKSLSTLLELTALDFENSLSGYKSSGTIKAPLSVGQ